MEEKKLKTKAFVVRLEVKIKDKNGVYKKTRISVDPMLFTALGVIHGLDTKKEISKLIKEIAEDIDPVDFEIVNEKISVSRVVSEFILLRIVEKLTGDNMLSSEIKSKFYKFFSEQLEKDIEKNRRAIDR